MSDASRGARAHGLPSVREGVSGRSPYVAVWRHGSSLYGEPHGHDAGFAARPPGLQTTKGAIRIRPKDAAEISGGDLAEMSRPALDA
jgi:hypothetical protein